MTKTNASENFGTPIPGEVTVESLAREQGWVPEEEYRGDSGRPHVSAADYLRKGREIRSSMKKRVERTDQTVQELRTAIKDLSLHQAKMTKAAIAEERHKWEKEKDNAIDDQDKEGVKVAEEELKRLDSEELELEKKVNYDVRPQQATSTFTEWHRDNDWYESDLVMTDASMGEAARYQRANPGASEADLLKHVGNYIRAKFPHEFDGADPDEGDDFEQAQTAKNPVSGARRRSISGSKGRATAAMMTPDQRTVAENFIRAGVVNPDGTPKTLDQFAQEYRDIGEL